MFDDFQGLREPMSSFLRVFRVDVAHLCAIRGSRNERILAGLESVLGSDWPDLDDDGHLSPLIAGRQIVMGEELDEDQGDSYLLAFAAMPELIGVVLYEESYVRFVNLVREADRALRVAGMKRPMRLDRLFFGGSPLPLPEPSSADTCMGFATQADVARAYAVFQTLTVSTNDHDVAALVADVGQWLKAASEANQGLVGVLT